MSAARGARFVDRERVCGQGMAQPSKHHRHHRHRDVSPPPPVVVVVVVVVIAMTGARFTPSAVRVCPSSASAPPTSASPPLGPPRWVLTLALAIFPIELALPLRLTMHGGNATHRSATIEGTCRTCLRRAPRMPRKKTPIGIQESPEMAPKSSCPHRSGPELVGALPNTT